MRVFFVFINLIITSTSFSQMRPVDKVYIVEGVVADRENLKSISSAILYNDNLNIFTTSDEKGYFKLVVPYELIKDGKTIPIDIVKNGYKRNGSGFHYNLNKADTIQSKPSNIIWNNDVKIFWMAKNESEQSSTSAAHIRAREREYSSAVIKQSFDDAVVSERLSRKIDQLKKGNEKVYFLIDGKVILATASTYMHFYESSPTVYINEKKVKLDDINKHIKRNNVKVDWTKSNTLSKELKKDVIVFIPTSESDEVR